MYGFLTVLEGSGDYPREVGLTFKDKDSAEQFLAFAGIYKAECGEQYGWEAYLASTHTSGGNKVFGTDEKMGRGFLDLNLVKKMALAICETRTGRRAACQTQEDRERLPKDPEYFPLIGVKAGAIVFSFDPKDLPPYNYPPQAFLSHSLASD